MARELVVRLIGDDASLRRSFLRSSAGAKDFERNISKASRGALVGAGIFQNLGRAVAFSSTSFLGGAGAVFAIKATSQAASNMNEQVSKSRQVFGASSTVVERFARNSLGLASDQAIEAASSFGALLRPMGILPEQAAQISTQMTQLGLDFSSFFNTDTADALQAIQSGLVGEVEPLRRYGVLLSAARVQQEALNETGKRSVKALTQQELVQARVAILFRDSAQAQGDFARTSGGLANQQRILQRNVRNLEIAVGTALNPTILTVTQSLNGWLSQSENQARVQRDVTEAVAAGREVVHDFAAVVRGVDHVTGSFKNTLELLVAIKFASVVAGWASGIGVFGSKVRTTTGEVRTLRTSLLELNAVRFGPLVAALAGVAFLAEQMRKDALATRTVGDVTGTSSQRVFQNPNGFFRETRRAVRGRGAVHLERITAAEAHAITNTSTGAVDAEAAAKAAHGLGLRVGEKISKSFTDGISEGSRRGGLTISQRNTFFDNAISRILLRGGLGDIQQQIGALQRADELIASRLRVTKDVTRKLNLEDQLLQNQAQIRSLRLQQAAEATQAAEDARQKLLDALQKAADARNARQFKALGLTATGDQRVPGVGALRRALGNVSDQIKGTFLDTTKTKSLLERIRKVLSGGLGVVGRDVRAKIQEILGDLNRQLDDQTTKNLTKWRHLSTQAFLAGIPNLTEAQKRQLAARFSTVSAGGRVPNRTPAFAGAGARPQAGDVYLDGEKVGYITHSHGIRRDRRRSVPRGG